MPVQGASGVKESSLPLPWRGVAARLKEPFLCGYSTKGGMPSCEVGRYPVGIPCQPDVSPDP